MSQVDHLKGATDDLPAGHREVSAQLTGARARARALPGPPSGLPDTLDEAYRIQAHSIAAWNDSVAGWKVGGVPPAYRERFDQTWLAGPIFARQVKTVEQGGNVSMPVFVGGFAAIEPEFIFQLGDTRKDDRLFIGAEIASSPIPDINDYGPVAVITDFGNNHGLAVGPEIADWRHRDGAIIVTTHIDGQTIAEKSLVDFREGAHEALAFLLELGESRNLALEPGTYVSSGAITGVHEAKPGARGKLDFGPLGNFSVDLVAADGS